MVSPASQEAASEGVSAAVERSVPEGLQPLSCGPGSRGEVSETRRAPAPSPLSAGAQPAGSSAAPGVLGGACAAGAAAGGFFSWGARSTVKNKQTTGCSVSSLGAVALQLG